MSKTGLVVLVLLASVGRARAEEENPAAAQVVQRRQYQLKHELTVSAGFLPLDAFYKALTVNVGYTYHFNPHFAWRVARGTFSKPFSTGLRKEIEGQYGLQVTDFPEVHWIVGSDLVWNALYGKAAFMNSALLHGGLYLSAGADLVVTQATLAPGVAVGGGLRLFVTDWMSLRLEVLDHVVIAKKPFNVLDLQIALAVSLGAS